MPGRIDAYIDCASLYSYFGFLRLRRDRTALKEYGVEIEFHPMFLGAVVNATGNDPPWKVKAKAKYLKFDQARAKKYFGTPGLKTPDVFPVVTVNALRCLVYTKAHYGPDRFEDLFLSMFVALWEQNTNLGDPEQLSAVLHKSFSPSEVTEMMKAASTPEIKAMLHKSTGEALERGAFGAPWLWLTNGEGREEPVFGSDRWGYLFEFLGIEWDDVAIVRSGRQAKL